MLFELSIDCSHVYMQFSQSAEGTKIQYFVDLVPLAPFKVKQIKTQSLNTHLEGFNKLLVASIFLDHTLLIFMKKGDQIQVRIIKKSR